MIDYIIIGLLVIVIILVIVLLVRGNSNLIEKMSKVETATVKELSDFRNDLTRSLDEDFDKLEDKVEKRLIYINDRVNERLDDNFTKDTTTLFIS